MSRITRFALLIGLSLGAGAAQAEGTTCGKSGAENWTAIRESLVGHWKITHLAGYARSGGMVIPFPADPSQEVLTIALIGDELEASHPDMQAPMVLRPTEEPLWNLEAEDPSVPRPSMTLSDLELVVNCPQAEMPRVIGTTSATVQGTRMDFVNRLVYYSEAGLYGVMEATSVANGIPVRAVRTVHLERQGKN